MPKFVVIEWTRSTCGSPSWVMKEEPTHPDSLAILDSRSLPALSMQYTALMQGKEGHCLPEVLAAWVTSSLLELLGTKYVIVSFAH